MAESIKLVVSNKSALTRKYGDSARMITSALDRMIAADASRGLQTTVVWLDDASFEATYGVDPLASVTDDQQAKVTVDAVCRKLGEPDFLMILGAPDVVPHQLLNDPVAGESDINVPSDLPYACTAGFGRDWSAFTAPTRRVGRLPDVTGSRDASYLVALIDRICALKPMDASHFSTWLGICAATFETTTRVTLKNLFGSDSPIILSPPSDVSTLGASPFDKPVQFFDCHGGSNNSSWFGNKYPQRNFPVILKSDNVPDLPANTVVSTEACYGAQLYTPASASLPLCNQFLEKGAVGFFGSTDILYGEIIGNQQVEGDLLTQLFLKYVLAGDSLGQATLNARRAYIDACGTFPDPHQQKTIVQCILLGDPSLVPVTVPPASSARTVGLPPADVSSTSKSLHATALARGQRPRAVQIARSHSVGMPAGNMGTSIRGLIKQARIVNAQIRTWHGPADQEGAHQVRFHVVHGNPSQSRKQTTTHPGECAPPRHQIVLVIREEKAGVVSVRTLYRH